MRYYKEVVGNRNKTSNLRKFGKWFSICKLKIIKKGVAEQIFKELSY